MLAELAARHALVRAAFDEASEGAGADLWSLSQQGPEDQLNKTEFTQPALLAAGVAAWRAWQARGGAQPALFAGHSLGEYAALVAAGALSLHDGAKLVRLRGQLMQDAAPAGTGAMAAVLGAEDALVLEVCKEASGDDDRRARQLQFARARSSSAATRPRSIARSQLLAERGVRKAVKLAVSVPSHTPLMREAANRLSEAMNALAWSAPDRPVVQNVDAEVHDTVQSIRDALVRQLYLPVQWTGCVQALAARGATRIAECGPGKVLTGLVKRIDKIARRACDRHARRHGIRAHRMEPGMSEQLLKGEVALVTGASRGIGAAIADELAALGATVIGTATTRQRRGRHRRTPRGARAATAAC